jgi:hypothetical protein
MATTTTYAIYWLPAGAHFEPSGRDAHYRAVIERFLRDVGGTPFYGLLTQYSRDEHGHLVRNGPIANRSAFAGAYVDPTPYPHARYGRTVLMAADLVALAHRVFTATGWTPGRNKLFLFFLAAGIYPPEHCASHGAAALAKGAPPVIFAILGEEASLDCHYGIRHPLRPTGDAVADGEISDLSHELFETVTDPLDPLAPAWYHQSDQGEIGDRCEGTLTTVVLHGHRYVVQKEWSNQDGRCRV